MLTTPPIASEPQSVDWGPRNISIDSMLDVDKYSKLYPPPGEEASFTGTPSTKTSV